jgi:hypothetical protein
MHGGTNRKDKRGVDLICDSRLFWGEQPPFAPAVWGAVYSFGCLSTRFDPG